MELPSLWTPSDADSLKLFRGERQLAACLLWWQWEQWTWLHLPVLFTLHPGQTHYSPICCCSFRGIFLCCLTRLKYWHLWQEALFSFASPIEILSFKESKLYQRWCCTDCCPYAAVSAACCEHTSVISHCVFYGKKASSLIYFASALAVRYLLKPFQIVN